MRERARALQEASQRTARIRAAAVSSALQERGRRWEAGRVRRYASATEPDQPTSMRSSGCLSAVSTALALKGAEPTSPHQLCSYLEHEERLMS